MKGCAVWIKQEKNIIYNGHGIWIGAYSTRRDERPT